MLNTVKCFNCGAIINAESIYCTKCGSHKPVNEDNICLNTNCDRNKTKTRFMEDDQFCDLCGQYTTFGKKVENALS